MGASVRSRTGATGLGTANIAQAQFLAPDDKRTRLYISNGSGATIYVGFDATVDTTEGFPVANNGTFTVEDYVGPIHVVAGTNSNVFNYYVTSRG